jgi:hypothetical protein
MEQTRTGSLATLVGDGPRLDAIVFDRPSRTKVVVAVIDSARGPVFRTVHPDALVERTEEGSDDRALRMLIRRTPTPVHGSARDGAGEGHGRAGHARSTMHRTTGK